MKRTGNHFDPTSNKDAEDPHDVRAREMGFTIMPDEKRYMDRLDRKDGSTGASKRTKGDANKSVRPKTALEREPRSNQAFDSTRSKEEKEYNDILEDMLPKRRANRTFEGNDAAIKKALYGSANVVLHRAIDMFEPFMSPASMGVLAFLTPVMRKRISGLDLYDQVETKLRPVDFRWNRDQYEDARFPAGARVNVAVLSDYIETNTGMDVWKFEMSLPNNVEKTPEWVVEAFHAFIEKEEQKPANYAITGMTSLVESIAYVGLMALDLILDPESLFHMRLLYAYGTLNDSAPRGATTQFTAGVMAHEEYLRVLEAAKVTSGENRFRLERHDILRVENINPVFNIPATYLGRYYFSPSAADNVQENSLEALLKENAKIWDTRPLFDELDGDEKGQPSKINATT